jgi:hypothetical protein
VQKERKWHKTQRKNANAMQKIALYLTNKMISFSSHFSKIFASHYHPCLNMLYDYSISIAHVGTEFLMMRRCLKCGDSSYDVLPPAGPPSIAAFWTY